MSSGEAEKNRQEDSARRFDKEIRQARGLRHYGKGAVPVSPSPARDGGGVDDGLGQSEASGLEMNLANRHHIVTLNPDFCLLPSLVHNFGVHTTRYDMTFHNPREQSENPRYAYEL